MSAGTHYFNPCLVLNRFLPFTRRGGTYLERIATMTKPIKSYPVSQRKAVVDRRLAGVARGIGWLSAMDYMTKLYGQKPVKVEAE